MIYPSQIRKFLSARVFSIKSSATDPNQTRRGWALLQAVTSVPLAALCVQGVVAPNWMEATN